MIKSKLPARPSLESLRKQAKKLAHDIAAGNTEALARAHAQLPKAKLPLSQRDAQLVLAREYGFAGWQELLKEVKQRIGECLEWAASEARRIIHNNDVEGLGRLVAEFPALLSWKADDHDGGLLGMAAGSFGDSGDAFREERFTRMACAEFLLKAGAVVSPSVFEDLIRSRARGLIDLFQRRGLLPPTLKFLAALDDIEGVRARIDTNLDDLGAINEAFKFACHFGHANVASLLLDRSIALDADLAQRIDGGPGRSLLIKYFIENRPDVHDPDPFMPWQSFVERQIQRSLEDGNLGAFIESFRHESWLLSASHVKFQIAVIERVAATLQDRAAFLEAFLHLDPFVLHSPVLPPTAGLAHDGICRVYTHAFSSAHAHLLPMLQKIWPMPHDLPHAAGSGDFANVKRWFDASGRPALGDLAAHFPANDAWIRGNLQWGKPNAQQVIDTAFAFAVMNHRFEIADFLLARGANINTDWSSHEPASILHELVWHKDLEAMHFLIDRGIDMAIHDYRWDATAVGWAEYAAKDRQMAQWMRDAQKRREQAVR